MLVSVATCRAQYHPIYSQYMFNGLAINPAYAGSSESLNIAAIHRNSQWGNSIANAPVTQTVAFDTQTKGPKVSLGMTVFSDKTSMVNSGAYFAYSYRIAVNNGKLSFGIQAGFDLRHENQSRIRPEIPDDPMFNGGIHNNFMPNAGVGTYYYRSNFFAGFSIPLILAYSPQKAGSYRAKPTFTNSKIFCGVTVPTPMDIKIKPSSLVQFAGNDVIYDLNCNFAFLDEKLELGVSWRSGNTLVGMFQIKISQLRIGYAYDYALEKLQANSTTHEIMLRLDMKIRVKAASPLFF